MTRRNRRKERTRRTRHAGLARRRIGAGRRRGLGGVGKIILEATENASTRKENDGYAALAEKQARRPEEDRKTRHRVEQVQPIARHTSDPSSPRSAACCSPFMRRRCNPMRDGRAARRDRRRTPATARRAGLPLDGHAADVVAAAYSPDRRWLAIGAADGLVRLHDLTASDPHSAVHDLAGHHGPVAGLVFAADGRRLVSAGSDGTLRLWQVDAGASPIAGPMISVNAVGAIRALAASPDGRWLAFGTKSGHLCLWRWLADGPEEAPCDPVGGTKRPSRRSCSAPKGRWLATTCAGACRGCQRTGAAMGPVCTRSGARTEAARPQE